MMAMRWMRRASTPIFLALGALSVAKAMAQNHTCCIGTPFPCFSGCPGYPTSPDNVWCDTCSNAFGVNCCKIQEYDGCTNGTYSVCRNRYQIPTDGCTQNKCANY